MSPTVTTLKGCTQTGGDLTQEDGHSVGDSLSGYPGMGRVKIIAVIKVEVISREVWQRSQNTQ